MQRTLERHIELLEADPRQAAFDGRFTSKDNVETANALAVEDIAFNRKSGLKITDSVGTATQKTHPRSTPIGPPFDQQPKRRTLRTRSS